MIENSYSDTFQCIKIGTEFFEHGFKLSKETLNLLVNFLKVLKHSYDNQLIKKTGKVSKHTMNKISRDRQFVELDNNPQMVKMFEKLTKRYGIPVYEIKGVDKLMPEGFKSKKVTYTYPTQLASTMEQVKKELIKYAMELNKEPKNEDEIIRTNVPVLETAKNLGCDHPQKEFDKAFFEQFPKEKQAYEEIISNKSISEDKKKEIKKGIEKNASKMDKFAGKADYYTVTINRDRVYARDVENKNLLIKTSPDKEDFYAISVPMENIKINKDGTLNITINKNDYIRVCEIKSKKYTVVPFIDILRREGRTNLQINQNDYTKKEEKTVDFSKKGKEITLDKSLIIEQSKDGYLCRIPGTYAESQKNIFIKKEDSVLVNGGKTILTFVEPEKKYEIFNNKKEIIGNVAGGDIYKHFDEVNRNFSDNKNKKSKSKSREKSQQHKKQNNLRRK